MDFQYCDNCGDITQGSHGSGSEMLCASCAGTESPQKPASGLQLLDDPSGLGVDLSGQGATNEKLDLFSSDSIASNQVKSSASSPSSLKLVTGSSTISKTAAETPGAPFETHSTAGFQESGPPSNQPKPGSTALSIGSSPSIDEDVMDMTQRMLGSLNQEPERWRVDCLHCAGSLSVKPAMKKSRLKCPRCEGVMVLDPSGTVRSVGTSQGTTSPTSQPRSVPNATAPVASAPQNSGRGVSSTPGESVAILTESPVVAEKSPTDPVPQQSPPPGRAPQMRRLESVVESASREIPHHVATPADTTRSSAATVHPAETPSRLGSTTTAVTPAPLTGNGPVPASSGEHLIAEGGPWLQEGAYTGSGVPTSEPVGSNVAEKEVVNSSTSLFWVTLALLPSALGILIVHESSGLLGESILNELGMHVSKNSGSLLDWCARLLGK